MAVNFPFARSHVRSLIPVCVVIVLLACPVGSWTDDSVGDLTGPRSDDWITINKDAYAARAGRAFHKPLGRVDTASAEWHR